MRGDEMKYTLINLITDIALLIAGILIGIIIGVNL